MGLNPLINILIFKMEWFLKMINSWHILIYLKKIIAVLKGVDSKIIMNAINIVRNNKGGI